MDDVLTGRPWAQAPWELVTADISAQAFRVAMAIQLHRSPEGRAPFPSHRRLAEMCRVSRATVLRAIDELTEAGFLRVAARVRADGARSTNEYFLSATTPRITGATIPCSTGATTEVDFRSRSEVERSLTGHAARAREIDLKVNGKICTDEEKLLALEVLDIWNEKTEQSLSAASWLQLIVRRHREHPEVDDFGVLIDALLARPWWDGAPKLNMVFGNDMQFEATIEESRAKPTTNGHKPQSRFGRGMTTAQILEMKV